MTGGQQLPAASCGRHRYSAGRGHSIEALSFYELATKLYTHVTVALTLNFGCSVESSRNSNTPAYGTGL